MLIPSTAEIELAGQSEPDRQGIGLLPVGLRGFVRDHLRQALDADLVWVGLEDWLGQVELKPFSMGIKQSIEVCFFIRLPTVGWPGLQVNRRGGPRRMA